MVCINFQFWVIACLFEFQLEDLLIFSVHPLLHVV
jgi:hypothetical protein